MAPKRARSAPEAKDEAVSAGPGNEEEEAAASEPAKRGAGAKKSSASKSRAKKSEEKAEEGEEEKEDASPPKRAKRSASKPASKTPEEGDNDDDDEEATTKKTAKRGGKGGRSASLTQSKSASSSAPLSKSKSTSSIAITAASSSSLSKSLSAASRSSSQSQEKEVIERPDLPREEAQAGRFKIISWNVTTLRSLVNKNQAMLKELFEKEDPDLVCIQEIKLNQSDQAEYDKKLAALLPGYTCHWNFCTLPGSKSYAGTVAIARTAAGGAAPSAQKTLDAFVSPKSSAKPSANRPALPIVAVTCGLPTMTETDGATAKEAQAEGRTVTVEYEPFFVVATYVPNSGDKLQRLDFRTSVWDKRIGEYLKQLQESGVCGGGGKPVVWCGDLNVAHRDTDIWNAGAPHLKKVPGTTPVERESFSCLLEECKLTDTFRHQHKDVSGWFSYWSVRAGNRPWNRGLRLDYFLASASMLHDNADGPRVVDSAILPDMVAIDHAAIALTLQV